MRSRRPLILAGLVSLLVHVASLFSLPADFLEEKPEPTGASVRLLAKLSSSSLPEPSLPPVAHPQIAKKSGKKREGAKKPAMLLPGKPETEPQSADSSPVVADSESAPSAPQSQGAQAGATPVAQAVSQSSAASQLLTSRIPEQGRVIYSGKAGGFISIQAQGVASWSHDGEFFESRLAAGLASIDSSFDYRANGSFSEQGQLVIENSLDVRRGRVSSAAIDHAAGKVFMSRGADRRERSFTGLAVALAALPQMLMALDPQIEKAEFFIIGDFWVEDSLLLGFGTERIDLPVGELRARHLRSKIPNGKIVDVWLAEDWQLAPVRIRFEADGLVVDLKAREVEINGRMLGQAGNE